MAGGTSDQLRWLEIDTGVKKEEEDAPSEMTPSENPSSEDPASEDAPDDAVSGENADGENVISENATSVAAPSVAAPSIKASIKTRSVRAFSIKSASVKVALDDITDVDPEEATNYVLQCHDDVNNHVRQINEALNLISIMGPTRSGKSTLMNLLAGCTEEPLFSTSPGAESWTRGKGEPTAFINLFLLISSLHRHKSGQQDHGRQGVLQAR